MSVDIVAFPLVITHLPESKQVLLIVRESVICILKLLLFTEFPSPDPAIK